MGQSNMQVIGRCASGWIPSGVLGSEFQLSLSSGLWAELHILYSSYLAALLNSSRIQPDNKSLFPISASFRDPYCLLPPLLPLF